MILAPITFDEKQRTIALLNLKILDTDKEDAFDGLAELAAFICDSEFAGISFIENKRQWFKASVNIVPKEVPRDISFCGHALLEEGVMIIEDTLKDIRFFDNPNVIDGNKIRFYAGATIICDGAKVGTVCVLDSKHNKKISEKQLQGLKLIALQATKLLELRKSNEEIKDLSNKAILAEKYLADLNIGKSEEKNDAIAYELHENIAQLIVAAKIQIEVIKPMAPLCNKEIMHINEYLGIALNDVINLSNSITPTTFKDGEYIGYIETLIFNANKLNNINIEFVQTGGYIALKSKFGLAMYRIIQYQLYYATLANATSINFNLHSEIDKNVVLILKHNGKIEFSKNEQAIFFYNNILNRAEFIGATFENDIANSKMIITYNIIN